jgi:hypothetical protein
MLLSESKFLQAEAVQRGKLTTGIQDSFRSKVLPHLLLPWSNFRNLSNRYRS